MPTLHLRTLGVSYSIEGLARSNLEPAPLLSSLIAQHGEAVAAVGVPPEAVLIDASAITWNDLLDWLETWVRTQGYSYASWARDASIQGAGATLHFHRTGQDADTDARTHGY